jgi:type II secretion system protein N
VRLGRFTAACAAAVVLFAAVLACTFPTDVVVRHVLARIGPPRSTTLVFQHAALRPWGLRLDQVALRDAEGGVLASADWVHLRPSLLGLARDRTGRPLQASALACGGRVDAMLGVDSVLALEWHDLDLGSCPLLSTHGALAGRADGTARLRLSLAGEPEGEGRVTVRGARMRLRRPRLPLDELHVDPALVRWSLAAGRLSLGTIELQGPDVEATGNGTVRLAHPLGQSAIDLHLTVVAGAHAPPELLGLVGFLPPSGGGTDGRDLRVRGTVDEPRLGL